MRKERTGVQQHRTHPLVTSIIRCCLCPNKGPEEFFFLTPSVSALFFLRPKRRPPNLLKRATNFFQRSDVGMIAAQSSSDVVKLGKEKRKLYERTQVLPFF